MEWYKGVIDKDSFEKHLYNSFDLPVLKQLVSLLKDRLKTLDNKEQTLTVYDNPSWSHKQAHINGAKQSINSMLDLLAFVKESK